MCWNIWNIWSLDSYCRTELSFPSIVMFSLNSKLSMFYLFLDHSPPIFALLLLIFQSQRRYCFLWEPFLDPAYLSPNICAPIALCTCHHVNPCDQGSYLFCSLVSLPHRVDANRYLRERKNEWMIIWIKGQVSSIGLADHIYTFAIMATLFQYHKFILKFLK